MIDSLEFESSEKLAASYDLSDIEPFTLVMIVNGKKTNLDELKWDGSKMHLNSLDPHDFHMWSSVTLYSEELMALKEKTFRNILQQPENITSEVLLNIHESNFLYEDL